MLKEFRADTLTVRISENRQMLGADAATLAADRLRKLLKGKDFVNIVFAAAPSQNEFLATLALEKNIDWKRVRAFHMDEYTGLSEHAPQRFGKPPGRQVLGVHDGVWAPDRLMRPVRIAASYRGDPAAAAREVRRAEETSEAWCTTAMAMSETKSSPAAVIAVSDGVRV